VSVETMAGELDASDLRIGVVRSTFNPAITDGLLAGALATLDEAKAHEITVVETAGAFELPLLAARLAERGYDAVIAIGAIVEGETDHYEHIAHRASEGLMRVMLDFGIPVAFGVLTVRSPAHAVARSGEDDANKGAEAAAAAVRAATLLRLV
jgi:6,7-dimethyl-8-ribityllumazine synthase